jgi:hypothetical protein
LALASQVLNAHAADTFDLSEPVALTLIAVLHIGDDTEARTIIDNIMGRPGG